jgi:hypothetical protein
MLPAAERLFYIRGPPQVLPDARNEVALSSKLAIAET